MKSTHRLRQCILEESRDLNSFGLLSQVRDAMAQTRLDRSRGCRAPFRPVGFVEPMLPTLVDAAPEGDDWLHEIKYDGYRTELTICADACNRHDWIDTKSR